jgi:4'-phosphopantetheinyl transferase EntD
MVTHGFRNQTNVPAKNNNCNAKRMMMGITDSLLQTSLEDIYVPGVAIGHRIISVGDESALLPEEAHAFANSVIKVRRASGAARIVARELLGPLIGQSKNALPKSASGAPIWPEGVVGSLAHDSTIAIAAIGMRHAVVAVGIDIEPAEFLPPNLLHLIATPRERYNISADPYRGRLLFVAKEAVYKAVHPLDHEFLEHHDVEIDFAARKAFARNGRTVDFRFCISTHIVAVAFILAS